MNRWVGASLFLAVSMVIGCADPDGEEPGAETGDAEQTAPASMRDAGVAISDASTAQRGDAAADAGAVADAGSTGCAALTYETFGKAFLQQYCVGCHSGPRAPDQIDLSTLAGAKKNKTEVVAHAVRTPRSKPMPPPTSPQPAAAERARLGEWLTCGPN